MTKRIFLARKQSQPHIERDCIIQTKVIYFNKSISLYTSQITMNCVKHLILFFRFFLYKKNVINYVDET